MAIKLALTGNIGCGKTLIGNYLKTLNFPVIDSDYIVHELLHEHFIIQKIVSIVGDSVLNEENKINKKLLGNIIFYDTNKKYLIEKLIHPLVLERTKSFFDRNKHKLIIINLIPLLFEIGVSYFFDYTCTIYCDELVQKNRLINRDKHLNLQDIQKRMLSQMPQNMKKILSNYIIDNSFNKEFSYIQTDKFIKLLLKI